MREFSGSITTFSYSAEGRLVKITTDGEETRIEYDETGKRMTKYHPDGSVTEEYVSPPRSPNAKLYARLVGPDFDDLKEDTRIRREMAADWPKGALQLFESAEYWSDLPEQTGRPPEFFRSLEGRRYLYLFYLARYRETQLAIVVGEDNEDRALAIESIQLGAPLWVEVVGKDDPDCEIDLLVTVGDADLQLIQSLKSRLSFFCAIAICNSEVGGVTTSDLEAAGLRHIGASPSFGGFRYELATLADETG
jgi:YD repeat-containing protein